MKTKFLRVSLLILAFSLVIGAAVATIVSANDTETKVPEIISQNIEYNEKFSLMYAVKQDTVTDPANLKLCLYDVDPVANPAAQPIRVYTEYAPMVPSATNNIPAASYVFTTDGVAATAMLKDFYAVAVEGTQKSAVKKYSVAEYLYERLGTATISAEQKFYYNATIEFGASAQEIVAKETNPENWITNYSYVTVYNGTIGDTAYSSGVYKIGTDITPKFADGVTEWNTVAHFETKDPVRETTSAAVKVAEGSTKTEISSESIIWYRNSVDSIDACPISTKPHWVNSNATISSGDSSSAKDPTMITEFGNNKFGTTGGTRYYEYIEYEGRGTVVKFEAFNHSTLAGENTSVQMYKNSELPDSVTPTAFECSFDLKILTDGTQESYRENIRFVIYNTKTWTSEQFYFYYDTSLAATNQSQVDSTIVNGVDSTDWVNVRLVLYASDLTHVYLYLNGSNEPVAVDTIAEGKVTSLDGVNNFGIVSYSHNSNAQHIKYLLLDNIFCGPTTETLPSN